MRRLAALALSALAFAASPAASAQDLADLAWLAGSWTERKVGSNTEEHWLTPSGGLMVGMNRAVRDGAKTSFEFLRIEMREGKPAYLASPGGREATVFPMAQAGPERIVFENPAKEFPRRITYWREGELLFARTEGRVRGEEKTEQWRFERLR